MKYSNPAGKNNQPTYPIQRIRLSKRNKKSSTPNTNESIPEEFLDRLRMIIPADLLDQTLESMHRPKDAGFRFNPLLSQDKTEVLKSLEQQSIPFHEIDWFADGYIVEHEYRSRLVDSLAATNSQIYIQNPSSILPCLVLDPQPEEQVLDLAAAPGGKTLLLAALMNNLGWLSAVEAVRNRFFKLDANLKRYGATITKTFLKDGRTVGKKVPGRFDRVLIDTPCSGESRIHVANPESYQFWSLRKLKEQARKQFGLIRSAFDALRPGGKLVYCTCSFAPEENEQIVSEFLQHQELAELVDVHLPSGVSWQPGITEWNGIRMHVDITKSVRVIPDQKMNGFYIAAVTKLE